MLKDEGWVPSINLENLELSKYFWYRTEAVNPNLVKGLLTMNLDQTVDKFTRLEERRKTRGRQIWKALTNFRAKRSC